MNITLFDNKAVLICIIIAIYTAITLVIQDKILVKECLNSDRKKQIIASSIILLILTLINTIGLFYVLKSFPSTIYIIAIILIISYYSITIINIKKTIKLENEQNKVNELEGNNTRLMESFEDIRSFRHDMKNIMQGLGGYIQAKDMDGLTNMYNEFMSDCKEIQNTKDFEKLGNTNPAIYNLINNKYLEAKKDGININVGVYVDLNVLKIKTYELCRVLGILIDNAIEATKECDNKEISIKFIKDKYNNRNLVIIENPYKNTLLDLSKLKQKGFTTKKDKKRHGLGLWRVNKIVAKNDNLRLTTSREDNKIFKQQLEIYNW